MKTPVDWPLISEFIKARARYERAKAVTKKKEIAEAIRELEHSKEAFKAVKKEIANRFPVIVKVLKQILNINVSWKEVKADYRYPEVDVRLRDDAVLNASKITDEEQAKITKRLLKELKKSA